MNKTMIIVGAGEGISMAAAKKFGKEGYSVALIARRKEALDQYVSELTEDGVEAKGFQGDASDENSLSEAISAAIEMFGSVHVLLYNAAAGTPGKPTSLTADDLTRDFSVSVGGALTSVKAVLPAMEKTGGGSILLTGGGLALHPYADYSSLAIGKAGIRNLAYSLSQELEPKGIYVGTLTIKGFVQEGTSFSSGNIAERYFQMHAEKKELEAVFEGE
ncbi:SDR family NAD(P)-dependent oxidoreductase [Bacillus sp. SJS]|uniref:SDR family NAD(P)-dependent oxidoreductase n=1 Tax=Bacillus sp. SJS TaxID=1423321 RepID=UPI000A647F90|nr:SDR family NAD(P)-dependent oxidoreductase [Bacillus sp. SJS]